MSRSDAIARTGARVLLVDAAQRVLLMRGADPARPDQPYWFTVGGGLDPGETSAQGASRELYEETGLAVEPAALGAAVWHEIVEFPWDGQWYRQDQEYFLVRVPEWDVRPAALTELEVRWVDAYRWWSFAELRATAERFYPPDLPDLVQRLLGVPC